jgi:type IV fimbrial biogenesis protein FimT
VLGALMQSPRSQRGLTIIELMVVVGVVAVLAALAAPSLRDLMARQRVAAINAELMTDLQFARSEAVARNRDVYVTFRIDNLAGQPPMTCYTVHTRNLYATCDCRNPLGTACPNHEEIVEIKTVQVLRSTTATLQPQPWPANYLRFAAARGLASWHGHDASSADYTADWQDYQVTVASTLSGQLRTSTNITGRPQVCTPDGSISGVARCSE